MTGAQGKLGMVLATAPRLFLFSALQLLLHLAFLLGVGRGVFRLPLKASASRGGVEKGGGDKQAARAPSPLLSRALHIPKRDR